MMYYPFMRSREQPGSDIRQVIDPSKFSHNNGCYAALLSGPNMGIDHFWFTANAFTIVLYQDIGQH